MKTLLFFGALLIFVGQSQAYIISAKKFTPFSMDPGKAKPLEEASLFSSDGENITFKPCFTAHKTHKAKEDCSGKEYVLGKKDKVLADLIQKIAGVVPSTPQKEDSKKLERAKLIATEVFRLMEGEGQRIVLDKTSAKKLSHYAEPPLKGDVTPEEIDEATRLLIGLKVSFPDKWNDGVLIGASFGACKVVSSCDPKPLSQSSLDYCYKLPTGKEVRDCLDRALANQSKITPVTERIPRKQNCSINLEIPFINGTRSVWTHYGSFSESTVVAIKDDNLRKTYEHCLPAISASLTPPREVNDSERSFKEVPKKFENLIETENNQTVQ